MQPELGREVGAAPLLDGAQLALRSARDVGHQGGGAEQTDCDAEEAEARDALGGVVDVLEDVGVAVEEGEEDDVDDGEVEGDEHYDWFRGGEEEGAVEGAAEAGDEGFLADFDFGAVALVAGVGAQVGRFPF